MSVRSLHTDAVVVEPVETEHTNVIEQLVATSGRAGFRLAFDLLGNASDAEDAVQEALARTCEHIDRLHDRAAIRGWYFRVLTNVCMRSLKRRRVRKVVYEKVLRRQAPAIDPHRAGVHGDVARVLRALDELPAKQRAAVVLRYGHDRSVAEVAALLGVGAGTVKTHLARGLRRLRELMRVDETRTQESS